MPERTVTAVEKIEEQTKQSRHEGQAEEEERREDTRKKIRIGAYFMEKYKDNMDQLVPQLDRFLVRDQALSRRLRAGHPDVRCEVIFS